MNILFVNYGNFTTNSLNHIGGFARALRQAGHDCIVAVPGEKDTLAAIEDPPFLPATYAEILSGQITFADGRPASLLHAWTPREGVRKFVESYQRLQVVPVVVHLEDNEDYLLESFGKLPVEKLRELPEQQFPFPMVDGLAHPVRYHHLLRLADGVSFINPRLQEFIPPDAPGHLLLPGVDFALYQPTRPAGALRTGLGLKPEEKILVFTGSVTFANAAEIRQLYDAVRLLNERGVSTRLIRTGFTLPEFLGGLGYDCSAWVLDLGFVPKPRLPALIALADALVQPGAAGPFNDYRLPSKLPEYLAMGKPVILPASNLGLEVADGREALVLQRGDAAEIAEACLRVFADASLASRLGRGARDFAHRHFDLARNTAGLIAFYEAVVRRRPHAAWSLLAEAVETDLPAVIARIREQLSTPGSEATARPSDLRAALADLSRAIRQLDANLVERRGTLSDWQRHARGLEETREILRKDIASIRVHAADHAHLLESEIRKIDAAARRSLERVRQLCLQYDHEVARLQVALQASEHRVLRLQTTFSWRGTAWLRALRRRLLDPYFGPPRSPPPPPLAPTHVHPAPSDFWLEPPAPKLHYHLDAPRRWPDEARELSVRGWLISESGPLRGIRARLGGRVYVGEYGVSRPDVGLNFKSSPGADYSGFRLTLRLEKTDETLFLETEDAAGLWHVFLTQPLQADPAAAVKGTYPHWVGEFATLTPPQLDRLKQRARAMSAPPLISVIMPVYNPPERWLCQAIDSVRNQAYPHWELCIADDASPRAHVRTVLERYQTLDPRIRVAFRNANGHISAASNSALALATGTYCALFDHDDELAPQALLSVAETLIRHPDTEVVYSDEDKIDEFGHRYDPHFKPDWNPELLEGQNYLSHLTVYRTDTMRRCGGFRSGYEGAQDWDLALRITDAVKPAQIRHLPDILYHWRAVEGSTATELQAKTYVATAAQKALAEHFLRSGQPVELHPIMGGHWQCRRPRPDPAPLVTLVIPTRNRRQLLEKCVESIFAQTAYPRFEILVADNESDDPELAAYYERRRALGRFSVLSCPGPFNYSAINNRAVAAAAGEFVGLLNNDLEVMHPEWLDELVSQAARPGIGCVGAKLYFPDMRIQHAGVIIGLGGVAGHPFKGFVRDEPGTAQFRPHLLQEVSAVTAACLLVRKSIYQAAGGLDEAGLAVAFNDVDFCLKVRALGYRNLFTPFAELLHHESASRGAEDTPEKIRRFQGEIELMRQRWGERLLEDPAYNPNLTLDAEDWGLAYPPRRPLADTGV